MTDVAVFIGRFQPVHNGHMQVLFRALSEAKHVLVLLGSANSARSFRNPFTADERQKMIVDSLLPRDQARITFLPLEDSAYNVDEWTNRVRLRVSEAFSGNPSVSLIGHHKDDTSYYLDLFPEWNMIEVEQDHLLDSTTIRESIFGNHQMAEDLFPCPDFVERYVNRARDNAEIFRITQYDVPFGVINFLKSFVHTEAYEQVAKEYAFVAQYKEQWKHAPYPPIFVTVDAVIVQNGHILLVKRGNYPGKGLWALPGGFLNPDETIEKAMRRELAEETGFAATAPIKSVRVFDDPFRSSRGRTITHAHLIMLPDGPLPVVTGADDAIKAEWVRIDQLDRSKFFEDHYRIIGAMLG